jgi:hypothetical protein
VERERGERDSGQTGQTPPSTLSSHFPLQPCAASEVDFVHKATASDPWPDPGPGGVECAHRVQGAAGELEHWTWLGLLHAALFSLISLSQRHGATARACCEASEATGPRSFRCPCSVDSATVGGGSERVIACSGASMRLLQRLAALAFPCPAPGTGYTVIRRYCVQPSNGGGMSRPALCSLPFSAPSTYIHTHMRTDHTPSRHTKHSDLPRAAGVKSGAGSALALPLRHTPYPAPLPALPRLALPALGWAGTGTVLHAASARTICLACRLCSIDGGVLASSPADMQGLPGCCLMQCRPASTDRIRPTNTAQPMGGSTAGRHDRPRDKFPALFEKRARKSVGIGGGEIRDARCAMCDVRCAIP